METNKILFSILFKISLIFCLLNMSLMSCSATNSNFVETEIETEKAAFQYNNGEKAIEKSDWAEFYFEENEQLFPQFAKKYPDYYSGRKLFYVNSPIELTDSEGSVYETLSADYYNFLIDCTPEMWSKHSSIEDPDKTFKNKNAGLFLDTPLGEVSYYNFYANFLKNHEKKNKNITLEIRKNLDKILQGINNSFSAISGGGKWYINESSKIPAYVEYYIWKYYGNVENTVITEESIKEFVSYFWFICQYRYNFEEEIYGDGNSPEIIYERMLEVKKNMDCLSSLITDNFYFQAACAYLNSKNPILQNND